MNTCDSMHSRMGRTKSELTVGEDFLFLDEFDEALVGKFFNKFGYH